MNSSLRRIFCVLCLTVLLGARCSSDEPEASPTTEAVTGSATVFSAASLTASFNTLKADFEKNNPRATVTFNFGPSSGLAAQIIEQGGADAFVSADHVNMKKVTDKGLVDGEPAIFIKNRLEIITGAGNPKGIKTLADLAKPDLKVILAGAPVPVGRYAREALTKAGVTVKPVSDAVDVKGVVGPVTLGEADAGIVYTSDVKAAGDKATGVEIPEAQNVIAEYPIAVIKDSPNTEVAQAFVDLVLSDAGQKVLTGNGFTAP